MNTPKKNILVTQEPKVFQYSADGQRGSSKFRPRNASEHGDKLLRQLDVVWNSNEQQKAMFASIKQREGTYIEFKGAEECDLVSKSLENITQGIELLNFRNEIASDGVMVQSATVFIPNGKENYFKEKVQSYLTETTPKGNEKHKPLVESIENIQLAVISSFWIGQAKDIPTEDAVWCEFWLRSEKDYEVETSNKFYCSCDELSILHKETRIVFPEKVVVIAKTNAIQIQSLLQISSVISEIRRAPEVANFFVNMSGYEAKEWIEDLKQRLIISENDSFVCILDTGINSAHTLLETVIDLKHIQTLDSAWGSEDCDGHGTEMAGICEYFNLENILSGSEMVTINHRLESVKILTSTEYNNPDLYGALTANAVSMAEIENPNVKRVYCMAVTANKYAINNGAPSSWSAELDNITAGVVDGIKKLYVVSAGNVEREELEVTPYPDANINHSVEDPGQSWNAITVGAYSDKVTLEDASFTGWQALAEVGELCPFSSTSLTWDNKWPIKPEILMAGGNVITDGEHLDTCDDVSLLTTNRNVIIQPFTTINATSAATAQAAYLVSELTSAYPELWEESIRALVIHSAKWTDKMIQQFCLDEKKSGGIRSLLRATGYGIADLERARDSYENCVNMVIQAELQPYSKEGSAYKTKDMHMHKLPWPSELLSSLGNTKVSMKVTLSYYIEPAPDQKGWNNKYRYSSSALRFQVINKNQSEEDFLRRVNKATRGDDTKDKGDGTTGTDRWFLGSDNRDVGSVHSDIWNGVAVDLADCNCIAVYPIIGWWRERHNLGRYNDKMRYSLVVSISTPEEEIDFYTPIKAMIEIPTEISV